MHPNELFKFMNLVLRGYFFTLYIGVYKIFTIFATLKDAEEEVRGRVVPLFYTRDRRKIAKT